MFWKIWCLRLGVHRHSNSLFVARELCYVTVYTSSMSVFSSDSAGLLNIIFLHIVAHRVLLLLQ